MCTLQFICRWYKMKPNKLFRNYRRRKIDETTYKKIENFLIRLREDRCHITMYKNNYKPKVDIKTIEGSKDFIPESVYKSRSKKIRYLSISKTQKKKSIKKLKSVWKFVYFIKQHHYKIPIFHIVVLDMSYVLQVSMGLPFIL